MWLPEIGVGYYPVTDDRAPYDAAYFEKYVAYSETEMGREINRVRRALVRRHFNGHLVDMGVGCGSFIESRPRTSGFDVNPTAVNWLRRRELYWNPYACSCEAASFWDSLEHIADFPRLLARVEQYAFVSLPVFRGAAHVLRSRHFRKNEHFWYFSPHGLINVMRGLGWDHLETNHEETALGREDIASFAFARRRGQVGP